MDDLGWLEARAGTGRALSSPRDSWASLPAWVAQLQPCPEMRPRGRGDATGADQDWQNKQQEGRPLPTSARQAWPKEPL